MLRSWSILLLLIIGCDRTLHGADAPWIKLTTEHFEMYTTNDRGHAAAVLQLFEEIHAFFSQVGGTPRGAPHGPVKIIAFRSEEEYSHYA